MMKALIASIFLILTVHSVLLELTPSTAKKCFLAQLSPDKTLQTKFAILRMSRDQCVIRLSINIIDQQMQSRQVIHDKQYICSQTKSNDPTMVKHTSEHLSFDGSYQICVEGVDIRSPALLVQLFMGEKLNPTLYAAQMDQLPLVQNVQLLEVEQHIQTIKRLLMKLGQSFKVAKQHGDTFDLHMQASMQKTKLITIVHVLLVIVFGIVWVFLVKQLKRQQ